jgi:hypothetical protein
MRQSSAHFLHGTSLCEQRSANSYFLEKQEWNKCELVQAEKLPIVFDFSAYLIYNGVFLVIPLAGVLKENFKFLAR